MTPPAFEKEFPRILSPVEDLLALPTVATELLRLHGDADSDLQELTRSVSADPLLAARILELANSSLFSAGEVSSLEEATKALGLETLKRLSLALSLVGDLPEVQRLEPGEFWRRSLTCAVSAHAFAELFGTNQRGEALLCGLVRHLGKLVMAQVLGKEYEAVVLEAHGWPSQALETARLGFSGADLTAALLRSCGFPARAYLAVGYLGRSGELPQDTPRDVLELVEVLEAGSHVEALLCGTDEAHALQSLHARTSGRVEITREKIEDLVIGLEERISEVAKLLSISVPNAPSHEDILRRARKSIMDSSKLEPAQLQPPRASVTDRGEHPSDLTDGAATDPLTSLPNRAAFEQFLHDQVHARLEGRVPRALGLILLDIDGFEALNQAHGPHAGDEVLRRLGGVLRRETRQGDFTARYGGEEFALVAPHTNPFGMRTLAERLRRAIEAEVIEFEGHALSVTASFGAACIAEFDAPEDAQHLVKLVERLLCRAKEQGRNRSEVFSKVHFPTR